MAFPQLPLSNLFLDEIGGSFTDHHGCSVGIRSYDVGHHRRVHDPEAFHSMHPAVLVNHRQGVGRRPHLTGAGNVVGSPYVSQQPVIQRLVAEARSWSPGAVRAVTMSLKASCSSSRIHRRTASRRRCRSQGSSRYRYSMCGCT